MTAVDDHTLAVQRQNAAEDEDFWVDLMPTAAELVIRSGLASLPMLIRKMIIPHDLAADLMLELHELGVVGPASAGGGNRDVLVAGDDGLAWALAQIAESTGDEAEGEDEPIVEVPASGPLVSLVKPAGMPLVVEADDAGTELVLRPDDDLVKPDATTPSPRQPQLLVAVRRGGAHLVTTLAKPDATHVQAVRFATRHGWVVSRGAMSWANRAYGGATHGHLREQVRIARLAGDREGLKEWIELLNDARNDRIHRLVNLPKALLGVLLAIGVAAGLALVLATLVGVVSFFATGPAGWVEWWALVGATLAFLAGLVALLWHIATWLLWPVLGWAAWREGKRVADPPLWLLTTEERAMVGGEIDERTITLALSHLGIKALNDYLKNGGLLTYTVPARRDGDGTYARVRVPLGVTAEEIAARRNKLAGNLSRAALETWPTKGDEENVLELWVADKGLLERGAGEWPLLHEGDCDVFAGVPVGRSQRGDLIQTPLFETNWLVGGRPGQGKTSALRTLLLGAALDPTVELWVFVMGESPDFDPFRPRLSRYAMGLDDAVFEAAIQALRDGLAEMERRGKMLGSLPGKPPKTSRKLAKRVELGLHPLVITMDECFPARTLVGDRPIETLIPGDFVPSWDERSGMPCDRPVLKVFRRRPSGLVRVEWNDGTSMVCTPGHPLMTKSGWCTAGALDRDSEVLCYAESRPSFDTDRGDAVHAMRGRVRTDANPAPVLAQDRPGVLLAALHVGRETGERGPVVHVGGRANSDVRAHDGQQPDGPSRGAREGVDDAARDRTWTEDPGRQREGLDRAAATVGGGSRLEDRARGADWEAHEWDADALEDRRSESRFEGSGGDRRFVSLFGGAPRVGSTEGAIPHWRRVDRVEVLEPGRDGRYGGLCPDGYVYNLEVAETHVYRVADGVVAHNCHELFGHPKYGKEAAELAIRLIKRGRKYGIILKLATQSPVADSIPREVTRNVSNGVAFSVADHVPNDALLGAGKFKAGIRATELRPTVDRGTSVAVGLTDAPFELIRWFYIVYEDGIDAVTPIITRAVQSMGPLRHTGPGETPTAPPDHLQAVEEAMRGEERVGTTEVLKRLAQDDPLTYQQPAWNHTRLTGLLAESGHEPRKLTGGRMFVVLDDVLDALARREAAEDDVEV